MRRALTLMGAVLFAAACGGGADGGSAWTGTVEDSAGVQIVRNSPQPIWGEGEAWGFEEVLTIGEAAGDPDYQFGQIAGLDATSDGRILVLDNLAQHIKIYSPEGVFERTIGQAGSLSLRVDLDALEICGDRKLDHSTLEVQAADRDHLASHVGCQHDANRSVVLDGSLDVSIRRLDEP